MAWLRPGGPLTGTLLLCLESHGANYCGPPGVRRVVHTQRTVTDIASCKDTEHVVSLPYMTVQNTSFRNMALLQHSPLYPAGAPLCDAAHQTSDSEVWVD